MKQLLILAVAFCLSASLWAQKVGIGTKVPGYTLTVKDSLGTSNYQGFAQVSPDGLTALGTYVSDGLAYLQTHTKTNLDFATNNGTSSLTLDTLGNFGVGTTTPTELLDVAGNANIAGQLKMAGNAGTSGQVLMKNGGNIPEWVDLCNYKRLASFLNTGFTSQANPQYLNLTWTAPPNVTSIFVEAWSGGGGATAYSSGGGGGYMSFQYDVTPGIIVSMAIGGGGLKGSASAFGSVGGGTSITINGITSTILGGGGAWPGDPITGFGPSPEGGGVLLQTTPNFNNRIKTMRGGTGNVGSISFPQISATQFGTSINYGAAGCAALFPNTGPAGGTKLFVSGVYDLNNRAGVGGPPGTGGAADYLYGVNGTGGVVYIHY